MSTSDPDSYPDNQPPGNQPPNNQALGNPAPNSPPARRQPASDQPAGERPISDHLVGGQSADKGVRTALIGAGAVVMAALISILPTLLNRFLPAQPPPAQPLAVQAVAGEATATQSLPHGLAETAAPTATAASLAVTPQAATSTLPPTQAPTQAPTEAPARTPLPAGGLVFATQIAPNGEALDPGTTFPRNINDLYAVFRADATPPGLAVDTPNPKADAYYAFLKLSAGESAATIGWRWYLDGEVVNEYATDLLPGESVWLQRYDYSQGGIFGSGALPPGHYTVVFLRGGNPALSAELTITP